MLSEDIFLSKLLSAHLLRFKCTYKLLVCPSYIEKKWSDVIRMQVLIEKSRSSHLKDWNVPCFM